MEWTWDWHPHPEVWLLAAAVEAIFLRSAARRRRAGRTGPRGALPFSLGVATFWLASDWPLHDLARALFSAHMLQHVLLTLVVPPLLLIGAPADLLRGALGRPAVRGAARALTRPAVAFVAFNAVLGLVHVPAVVELMSRSEPVHAALHAALLGSAFLLWIPVLSPFEELPRMSPGGALAYLLAQAALPMYLTSWLTYARLPAYLPYAAGPRYWGISPLLDQQLAGVVMGAGALFLGLTGIITWIRAAPDARAVISPPGGSP